MQRIHLWGLIGGLTVLAAVLAGCSLLFPPQQEEIASEMEIASGDAWLPAAQGQEEPAACKEDLRRRKACQEAKEALREEEEAQEREQGNYWVSRKETTDEGEVLTHIKVGLESDPGVQGLSADGDVGAVRFLLPNEEITQEIAEQVRELLEGLDAGIEGSGVWGMSSGEEWDWERAEVLLWLEGEAEEAEALLVVPAVWTEGQRLWGRSRPRVDVERALFAPLKVKKSVSKRTSSTVAQPRKSKLAVRKGSELKGAFRYCPYRYYGRLSSFRRVLCRDSWERWYYKQWQTGNIYDKWASLYNQFAPLALQTGKTPSMFLQGDNILIYGFERLEGDWLREMAQFASLLLPQTDGSSQANLPPGSILTALEELSQLLDDPTFAERLEELKDQYPDFAAFLSTFAQMLEIEEPEAARLLVRLAQNGDWVTSILEKYGRVLPELLRRGIIAVPSGGLLLRCCSPEWRYGTFTALVNAVLALTGNPDRAPDILGMGLEAALRIVDNFLTALERLLAAGNKNQLEKILNKIPGPSLPPAAPSLGDVKEFLVFAELLGNMFTSDVNWDLIDIDLTIFRGSVTIEIVATAQIPGLGQVTTFANSYPNIAMLSTREIQNIIETVQRVGNDPRYPGLDVAFIFVHGQTTAEEAESKLPASSAVPLVVVYCTANCNSANPTYEIAWRGPINQEQAYQIACSHGYTQFCGGPPSGTGSEGNPGEPPTVVTPPPPEPPSCLTRPPRLF